MDSTLFICYRRDDSAGYAGWLTESLSQNYGKGSVFIDVHMRGGSEFPTEIRRAIEACRVILVLIGTRWLEPADAGGSRRLDEPNDFVRLELEHALLAKCTVIPVLLDGASVPSKSELPPSIRGLVDRQAVPLSRLHWSADFKTLTDIIDLAIGGRRKRAQLLAGAALLGVMIIVLTGNLFRRDSARELRALAGASASAPGEECDGYWSATVEYDWGARHDEAFLFRQVGGELTGSASFLDRPITIVSGSVNGTTISFETHGEEIGGRETRHLARRYVGTRAGAQIRFVLSITGADKPHAPIRFIASRARAPG